MSSLLEDIVKFEAENKAKVYIYDGNIGGIRSDIASGYLYEYFEDVHESATIKIAVDLKTMTAGLYNKNGEYMECPLKGITKAGHGSIDKYLSSLSDDESSGEYAKIITCVPMNFILPSFEDNSMGIMYCEMNNSSYKTVDGKWVFTKKPFAELRVKFSIPLLRSNNGKFYLYQICDISSVLKSDFKQFLSYIEEKNDIALNAIHKEAPECNFALISDYNLDILVTDSKGNPMFRANNLGIIKNNETEMRLFGCVEKASKENECGILLSFNKESETFQARILSSVRPNIYSVGKDKSVPMTVSFDTSTMEYRYSDYAIIDMDERYMYLEKLSDSYYSKKSWEDLTRNKDNAYKYDMMTGDLVRTHKIPIEVDDLYESKKEGKR